MTRNEATAEAARRQRLHSVAFSPLTGRPTLVWTQYNDAMSHDVVLASTLE